MISMIIVASLAAYAFESTRWLVGVTFVVTIAFLPLIHSEWLYGFVDRRRVSLSSEKLRSLGEHLLNMLRTSADLLRSGPLYGGLALGLLAWFAEGYALYVVLDRMGADVTIFLAAGIYGVAILAGAVSFVPGGLGGTEVVMYSLLVTTGLGGTEALVATLLIRLSTLWYAVVTGLFTLLWLELTGPGDYAGLEGADIDSARE